LPIPADKENTAPMTTLAAPPVARLTPAAPRQLHIADDEAGFHGDHYVLQLVDHLMAYASAFVETGSYMGQTISYVAKAYPKMPIYSCEQNAERHANVKGQLGHLPHVHLYHQVSPDFLYDAHKQFPHLRKQTNLYWLDAHGFGFDQWPLRDEVAYLTREMSSALILIDDFQVPNRPDFGYDAYNGQSCALDYIYPSIQPGRTYYMVYPTYTQKTSKVHPLRGVGLLFYGVDGFEWPEHLTHHWQAYEFTK